MPSSPSKRSQTEHHVADVGAVAGVVQPRMLAGRYTLSGRIGAGGMGTILRATDSQMERDVAVKVLHRHLANDPDLRARFKAEARHAASLSHPNIVAVYDQGDVDLPYIVMELVDGPSLREVLVSHGPMSPAQMLTVIVPLCQALAGAHDKGLVHRDIKPENVLVTRAGVPKLADFGIARVMASTRQTATGMLMGSVHYLAPELVGGTDATPASDQYALSVMTFELLTARKPLPAETPMAIALRHANEDIPPPSRYAPGVGPQLDGVIAKASARDPGQRYPSVQGFGAALSAAVDAGPHAVTTTIDGNQQTLIMPPEHHETVSLSGPGARLQQGRGARTALRVAVGIACVALLVGGSYLLWDRVVAPQAAVPPLIGSSRTQAQARLQQRGLSLEIGAERNRLREPAGQVIGQRPAPGATLRDGSLVEVVLSLGPAVVAMPDLKGRYFDDIIKELQANAFEVAAPNVAYDDTVPAGQVISHDPPAATPIRQGSAITVTVSQGVEPVAVPPVEGRPLTQALPDLEQAGVGKISLREIFSDEVPQAGTIISQSLTAGTQVASGTPMTVTVSQGPLTIPLPQTRGLPAAEAVAALEQAGLVVVAVTEPVPMVGPYEMSPSDLVRGSVPAAGDVVQRGQSVEIYYFTPR